MPFWNSLTVYALTLSLWRRFRELSIRKYEEVYRRLNVHFDVYAGESLVRSEHVDTVMAALGANNLLTDKTTKESDANWQEKKIIFSQGKTETIGEDLESIANNRGVAKAVDFSKWNLGKPVVQKPGRKIYDSLP